MFPNNINNEPQPHRNGEAARRDVRLQDNRVLLPKIFG